MASRDEIISALDELLEAHDWDDYGPNGLQVPGSVNVSLVATGVSAHRELFESAALAGADLVLCHHGLFWGSGFRLVDAQLKARLAALFEADLSLAAYHLPLDAHPEVGNNALICEALGLERAERFGEHRGRPIGFVGRSTDGLALSELVERCRRAFGRPPLVFPAGPEVIHSLGVISGGGASSLGEAAELGLDAFLSGEPSEPSTADAREGGIHFIAAGHYATETFGIRRLGDFVAERFGVDHRFIEIVNPV